jgi:hypothetical protein
MDIAYVPIIVVCCYVIGELYKLIFRKIDSTYRFIPVVTIVAGGLLAVLIYFTAPELVNAENVYEALVIGFVSGAGSSGANQIIKQLFQKKNGGEK